MSGREEYIALVAEVSCTTPENVISTFVHPIESGEAESISAPGGQLHMYGIYLDDGMIKGWVQPDPRNKDSRLDYSWKVNGK